MKIKFKRLTLLTISIILSLSIIPINSFAAEEVKYVNQETAIKELQSVIYKYYDKDVITISAPKEYTPIEKNEFYSKLQELEKNIQKSTKHEAKTEIFSISEVESKTIYLAWGSYRRAANIDLDWLLPVTFFAGYNADWYVEYRDDGGTPEEWFRYIDNFRAYKGYSGVGSGSVSILSSNVSYTYVNGCKRYARVMVTCLVEASATIFGIPVSYSDEHDFDDTYSASYFYDY